MEEEELSAIFQPMIDSIVIWHFPIDFIHTAVMLLQHGICTHEKFQPRRAALERTK